MKRTIKITLLSCLLVLICTLTFTACSIIGKYFPEATITETQPGKENAPSTGEHAHVWSEWVTVKAAKCEEAGLTQRYCTVCFYTESQPINALGHTEVLDEAVAPTCTEIGLTEGKHCSVCSKVFVAQEVIPAKNHQYENTFCTRCGYSQYILFELPSEGDSYKVWGVESDYPSSLVIPSTYLGKPVTSIGRYAFDGCSRLTSITIPDSVTSIDYGAFNGCTGLTTITLSDSLTTIGSSAFRDCNNLTSITIPDSVTTIGDYAFRDCSSLTSITIPDSVTSIGECAFYGCSSLTSITIPDSVTTIGDYAFCDCSSLTSITIPDSVTTIGNSAFYGCSRLTSITIPDSVTSIGECAFYGCSSLTNITFEGTVAQWKAITFGSNWNGRVPATEIVCSDGVVKLN